MKKFNCAVVTKNGETYTVDNLIVFDAPSAIPAVQSAMGYDYLLPVDDRVQIGDIYDPDKDIFTRDGERIYPDLSDKERIAELENQIIDTQAALIELAGIIGGADDGNG